MRGRCRRWRRSKRYARKRSTWVLFGRLRDDTLKQALSCGANGSCSRCAAPRVRCPQTPPLRRSPAPAAADVLARLRLAASKRDHRRAARATDRPEIVHEAPSRDDVGLVAAGAAISLVPRPGAPFNSRRHLSADPPRWIEPGWRCSGTPTMPRPNPQFVDSVRTRCAPNAALSR